MLPVYEASTLIQVHDIQTTNNNVFTDQALTQSYALLVNSPTVLQAVAQKIPGVSAQQLTSQVSDSPLDNTQILQIRATADTPNLAATISNTVAQVFIQQQTDRTTTLLASMAMKLEQDLRKAKQTLDNDQALLANLKDNHASQESIAHQNDLLSNDQISYSALQASYNQVEQQILHAPNVLTVVQPATPPTTSNSHTLVNTIIAAALSLLIMLTFVLLRDWIDTSLKTPNDVERLAGLHALGSIPLSKKALEQEADETNYHAPLIKDDVITQAFVGITTYFSTYGKGKQTFVVTSLHAKVGTSTAAANLALSLAQSNVRVLLIDAHLHNPSLQQLFQSSTAQGLTTVLTDHNWQQNVNANQIRNWLSQWQTHIPNLWLLPSGPTISQQATLMLSPVLPMFLKNMLNPASSIIDVVIFDAPPLEETTDTLAIAACADASILVIKAGKASVKMVQKAQEALTRLQAPVLGVIVNYQTPKHQSYFYTHYGQAQGSIPTSALYGQAQGAAPSPTETHNERELRVSSTQGTTGNVTPEIESTSLVLTPAERPSGPTLPAITSTPNNTTLGLGQFLNSSQAKNDSGVYKGKM
jgi:capsular exopolysaccharide synthesis family protein